MADDLASSFLVSVRAAGEDIESDGRDRALIELGIRYAMQIDAGMGEGGQAATKALYLGPHFVNTLRELGLTPAARRDVSPAPQVSPAAAEDELAAMRARARVRA